MSDSTFPQFSRTPLSILTEFNRVVIWIVFIIPLVFSSHCHFSMLLETVQNAPTIIDITVTLMFHNLFAVLWQDPDICWSFHFLLFSFGGQLSPSYSTAFFSSLARSWYLSIFSLSFIFLPLSAVTFLFYSFGWSVRTSKFQRMPFKERFCLSAWLSFNLLYNS